MRRGHVPQRMCSGCGGRFAKSALVRFIVLETGNGRVLTVDSASASAGGIAGRVTGGGDKGIGGGGKGIGTRGSAGRGGYVCPDPDCLEAALGRKTLLRRLKATDESPELRAEFARMVEALKQSG